MSQGDLKMDNYSVLVSASRYLNLVYNFELFNDDVSAAWKLRSYVKLLNEDEVLAEYWEMFKRTYHQEKALNGEHPALAEDFSLWDNNMSDALDINPLNVEIQNESDIIEFTEDYGKNVRIALPKGI